MQLYNFEIKYIPDKEVALQMLLVESTLKMRWNKRILISLHKGTQCMTMQMSMINGEQKKDATMQLFIQEFARRMALVLQEVDQALKVLSPET